MTVQSAPLAASRIGWAAAFAVIVAMTLGVLAPQQAAVIASMAITEGLPLAAWLLAGFGFGAICRVQLRKPVAGAVQPIIPASERGLALMTETAVGLGVISLATLLLGYLGLLNQWTAIGLVAIGAAMAIGRIYTDRNTIFAPWRERVGTSCLLLLAAPMAAALLLGACILPGVLWGVDDPSGYDVVAYHLQMPREWYELGSVTTLNHNVFSFFPLNIEMHYLLAMHLRGGPWAGMYLAQLMHGSFIALTVAAVYAATRSRGKLAASVAAIVCASVPWMPMLGGVAYNEGGLMLYATLAAAWAIRGRWGLAGTCAGLAAGCKLTGVPSAMEMVPGIIAIARWFGPLSLWERLRVRADASSDRVAVPIDDRSSVRPLPSPLPEGEGAGSRIFVAVRGLALFATLAVLFLAPWLVRTAIASHGNPIFPLAMKTLGAGHFDAGQVERFIVAHSPRPDQQSLGGRLAAFWQQVGGDYHFGAIELGVIKLPLWLLLIVPALILARRDREAWVWLALILGNIGVWLFATHLQGRFLVQIVPCVAMLVGCAIRPADADSDISNEVVDPRRQLIFPIIAIVVAMISCIASMRGPAGQLVAVRGLVGVDTTAFQGMLPDDVEKKLADSFSFVVLVGDAKAFWYTKPSTLTSYQSVFDVPSDENFHDAWLHNMNSDGALVIVDPGELRRLGKTYRNLPAVPEEWSKRNEPFATAPDGVPEH